MRVRNVVLSVPILLAVTASAVITEAGERQKLRRQAAPGDHYYAGPGFVHRMPGLRLLFGDYALSEEEFNALYGESDEFDETYYEPQPLVTTKPKSKPAAISAKAGNASLTTATLGDSPESPAPKKPLPAAKPAAVAKSSAAAADEQAPASTAMSCGKASSIIVGYGFSNVTSKSCKGGVFAFSAVRDGRTFAIKVDAASGELTEVKKLN